jgi:hypothetical protein
MVSQGMLLVMNDAQQGQDSEFCQWVSHEFMPAMRRVPGVTESWFYRAREGKPKYLQAYYFSTLEVLEQPDYLRVRGWGQGGDPKATKIISSCPNLIIGAYKHLFTAPASRPDLTKHQALLLASLEMSIPEFKEEFEDWYEPEHVTNLAMAPGVFRGHRYQLIPDAKDNQGDPVTYAAMYPMESLANYGSPEWIRLGRTPWMYRLLKYYTIKLSNKYERIC